MRWDEVHRPAVLLSLCTRGMWEGREGAKGGGVNTRFRLPLPPLEVTEEHLWLLELDGAESLKPCLLRVAMTPAK